MNSTKFCPQCRRDKPEARWTPSAFRRTDQSGRCKDCSNEYARQYHRRPEVRRASALSHWRTQYGLSSDQVESLLTRAKSRCEICGGIEKGATGLGEYILGVHIDHDPNQRRIRGLLCSWCNQGLGLFRHNIDLLHAAAAYLQEYDDDKRGIDPMNPAAPLLGERKRETSRPNRRRPRSRGKDPLETNRQDDEVTI